MCHLPQHSLGDHTVDHLTARGMSSCLAYPRACGWGCSVWVCSLWTWGSVPPPARAPARLLLPPEEITGDFEPCPQALIQRMNPIAFKP